MAITPIYGTRPGAAGWNRATTNHPYENLLGNAEEKDHKAVSGSGIMLQDGRK